MVLSARLFSTDDDHIFTSTFMSEVAHHGKQAGTMLWEVLGTEILIFILTLLFGVLLRWEQQRVPRVRGGKAFTKQQQPSCSGINSNSSSPKVQRQQSRGTAEQNQAESSPSQQQQRLPSPTAQCAAGLLLDKVVELSHRRDAGKEASEEILDHYAELLAALGESSTVADVSWWARCSPVEFYSLVVLSAFRAGRFGQIDRLLKDMKKQGVDRSLAFYEKLMKHFAGQRHFKLALSLYPKLIEDGFEPSITTRSCLVRFAVEVGDYQLACQFFSELCQLSSPSIRVCMTMLRAYSKLKDWYAARDVIYVMQRQGVELDSLVLNVALSIAVSVDKVDEGRELFTSIASTGRLKPDIVTYNTLIKGYVLKKDLATVQELLAEMQQAGIEPNVITRNTMAS